MNRHFRTTVGSILAYVALPVLLTHSTHAAIFDVNVFNDAVDANPGDGICNINLVPPQQCSLRAAVQEANWWAGADIIQLHPGTYLVTIDGLLPDENDAVSGDLDLIDNLLTIQSEGPETAATTIVDMNGLDRAFDVRGSSGWQFHLKNFTIQNGWADVDISPNGGGGIFVSSLTNQSVYLDGMIIKNNRVFGSGSTNVGGGVALSGGSQGKLEIRNSTLSGNSAARGGAIFSNTSLSVYDSTISFNSAIASGGIENYGRMDLTNVTVSGNHGSNNTGGIFSGYDPPAPLDTPLIRHSTIVNNTSGTTFPAGLVLDPNTEVSMVNTIIANNTDINGAIADCSIDPTSAIINEAYNLSSDNSCGLTESGDQVDTDPLLGPLVNNGGPTQTHLPLSGSPVINAGITLTGPGFRDLEKDQRGISRPQEGVSDIGSVEVEGCTFFPIIGSNGKIATVCL